MTSSFTDDLKIPIPPEVRTTRKVLKLARERPDIVEKMTIEALKYTSRVRFGKEIGSHSFMKAEAKKNGENYAGKTRLSRTFLGQKYR